MKRGANTFPFHNLLPYSESNEGLFLFFSPSFNWIKEKSVATLAIRTFAIQKSQSQFTVLHLDDPRNAFSWANNTRTLDDPQNASSWAYNTRTHGLLKSIQIGRAHV